MNTWKVAYQRLSKVLGVDLVSHPGLLAKRKHLAAKAATWYWTQNNINAYADAGDFKGVCSLINRGEAVPTGPINGWDKRLHFHKRALAILPEFTKPPEPEEPVVPDEPSNCLEALEHCRELSDRRRKHMEEARAEVARQQEHIETLRASVRLKDDQIEELKRKREEGDDMPDKPTVDPGPIDPKPPVFPEKPTKEPTGPLNIGKYAKAIFALLIPLITALITGYGADEFDWQEIAELAGAAVTGIIVYLVPNVEK